MKLAKLARFAAVLAALATLSIGARSHASAAAAPLSLDVIDVLGNPVHVASHQPTVLIFMSKRARDASAAFARAVDEKLLDRPVESISIVDVRRYGGILKSLASSYLRRSAEEGKVKRRERRQAAGVDASATAVDRWHLIGDFDGSLFARFGVEAEPKQPLAFVVDATGALHGPFRDVAPVVAALSR